MPLEADDQQRVNQAKDDVGADKSGTRVLVLNASQKQKLGFWIVVCTVINRAIGTRLCFPDPLSKLQLNKWKLGTGVFVTSAILLKATGSPGASLLLWTLGAITSICSLLVWLEFGLSIPKFELQNWDEADSPAEGVSWQNVPKSGGEKNYVGYCPHRYVQSLSHCRCFIARIRFWNR